MDESIGLFTIHIHTETNKSMAGNYPGSQIATSRIQLVYFQSNRSIPITIIILGIIPYK